MEKKKWRRVRLTDLGSKATQQEIMGLIDMAVQAPGPEPSGGGCCGCASCACGKNQISETATTGR